MEKKIIMFIVVVFATVSAYAVPSLQFGTGSSNLYSWTVAGSQGVYTMSFSNIEVDTSEPSPDGVLNDSVSLPSMTITNVHKNVYGMIEATLIPNQSQFLVITSDTDNTEVMKATVGSGGTVVLGKNWMAYSQDNNDLWITQYDDQHSSVINSLVAAHGVDMSFTGDSSSSLYVMLDQQLDGEISGTISGQISALDQPVHAPAPAAILLGSLGAAMVGWLRRRRSL